MGTETLRWGVLGTAKIARTKVIPAMQRAEGCEVRAIASRSREQAEEVAGRLAIPIAYGSYQALLEDPEIEAVYLPVPNHLHGRWTLAAVAAGKHVLCEKPLATSSAEAREMVEAASQAGVKLMEAFMYRLHPSWVRVRELVASGRLGRLRAVQSWFSYPNVDPGNIRNIAAYGGGALLDIGCYCVDLSRMLFAAKPERVTAAVRRDPNFGTDVLTSGILEFPDGHATFTCSTQAEHDQRVHIIGTEARVLVETPFNIPPDRPTRLLLASGGQPPVDLGVEVEKISAADQYALQAAAFARAVREGTALPVDPADSIANLDVIERLFEAAEEEGNPAGRPGMR